MRRLELGALAPVLLITPDQVAHIVAGAGVLAGTHPENPLRTSGHQEREMFIVAMAGRSLLACVAIVNFCQILREKRNSRQRTGQVIASLRFSRGGQA